MNSEQKVRRLFEGEVEACCHRIEFWYDIYDFELSPEEEERLTEDAEERAFYCIADRNGGCICGDLCSVLDRDGKDIELFGWWEIKRERGNS